MKEAMFYEKLDKKNVKYQFSTEIWPCVLDVVRNSS
jgi:hypothetical protein